MEILIRDLPGDVSEQELCEYLTPFGDIDHISMTNAGNHQRTSATVEMPVSSAVGEVICERIRHRPLRGHALRAETLLFFK